MPSRSKYRDGGLVGRSTRVSRSAVMEAVESTMLEHMTADFLARKV